MILLLNVLLEVIHQVSAIPLDLVCTRHGTEHDLNESSVSKWSVRDTGDDFVSMLDHGEATRVAIHNQSGDVFSRHFGELPLEEILETSEDDIGPFLPVIFEGCELDPPCPLLGDDNFLLLRELYTELSVLNICK